jgi:DNA invertase Pin-like site-specific DNA recombinase
MLFVTYLRVSTDRQGRSGLGLEAQRKAVADYVAGKGETSAEYVEIESGKRNDRPQLAFALAEAKRLGAVLLIAKLDRLARNVAFIANLLEAGVEIAAADMPQANRFLLHVMAAVAEHEAHAISERTRAALAAAKARGVALGWSIPARAEEQRQAAYRGAQSNAAAANRHAANVLPVIREIAARGASLRQIAAELNTRGIKAARGGQWYATTVRNILARPTDDRGPVRKLLPVQHGSVTMAGAGRIPRSGAAATLRDT